MGLGTKIKEVLHGDHQTTSTPSTSNYNTPGAFPSDDLPQKHADGKNYTAPHGTAVDDTVKPGTHTGATSGKSTQSSLLKENPLQSNIHPGLASSGTQRNRLSKGSDGLDQSSTGAYWGDLSKDNHQGVAGDLPDRTRLDKDSSAPTGRHHGAQGHTHHHDHRASDQAVGGGVYDAAPAQGSHGLSNRDPTEDSHFGQDLSGTAASRDRDHHLAGQSSGRGVHNSVTGAGSPEQYGSRTSKTGNVHHPASSGISSGNASGNTYDGQNAGFRGDGVSTSQNERTGHGHGLGVTGATAGAGAAAGYGAHEYGQHNHGSTGYGGGKTADGVPRSSMLDPEPALHKSNSPVRGQTVSPGYNDLEGTRGTSTGGNTGHFSSGPSHVNTNIGAGVGPGPDSGVSAVSPTQSASSGSGRKHYGPGHDGAKVLHSCQHCGRDNDISHYFNKDVVYRLGQ